jgi:hypothetical protein
MEITTAIGLAVTIGGPALGVVVYLARLEPRIANLEQSRQDMKDWLVRVEGKLDRVISPE